MELYIASGTHVDSDLKERIHRIENAIGEPDVVFMEGDSSAFSIGAFLTLIKTFPYAPLVIAAATFQIYLFIEFFGRIVSYFGGDSSGRDQELAQSLKNKYEIKSREVDLDLSQFINDNRLLSSVVNWAVVVVVFVSIWPLPITLSNIASLIIYELLAGYILFLGFLALVHEERNCHFAGVIADSQEEFENACLITGETHHAGTARFLKDEQEISLVNPEPESLSVVSKIFLTIYELVTRLRSI